MNFLCPACRTPLPVTAPAVVACAQCGVEVDLTRVDTAPGQARMWPEVDLKGEQLSTWRLTDRLGSGGMGTVYLAEGMLGPSAVKVLSAALAADPSLRERFRREAEALRQVQHPHVVRIIEEGQDRGFCWYAMEHVAGTDLRARLLKGPLSAAEVEVLARQLLGALGAVHGAQLVHRDLKPANILLSSSGARLCDFGIARFDGATTLTETAAMLGSLRYMAPEQRAGLTSPKSDLYSLGLVLHEALAGGLPGEKELPGSATSSRLIRALLQESPARRPADARAALQLLEPVKRSGLLAAAGAAVLLASALGVWASGVLQSTATPQAPARASADPARDAAVEVAALPPVVVDSGPEALALPDAGTGAQVASGEAVDGGPELAGVPEPGDAGAPLVAAMPARGAARVVMGAPTVEGGLDSEVLAPLLLKHRREIARCYEDQLAGEAGLEGVLGVRFTIDRVGRQGRTGGPVLRPLTRLTLGAGKKSKPGKVVVDPAEAGGVVIEVNVSESTLRSKDAIACILARIRAWKFPEPKGGPATVAVAWSFAPGPLLPEGAPRAVVPPEVKALLSPEQPVPSVKPKPGPTPAEPPPVGKPLRTKGKVGKAPPLPVDEGG